MTEPPTNEFLDSQRAQDDENDLFAAIGKRVLGLQMKDEDEPAEDERVKVVEEIESLCMNCRENGTTRLLLTKIPYFREIILMSFYCDQCHFKNNEVQPAGEIQEQAETYTFKPDAQEDLQRQIIKSDTATLKIEEIDIEIPARRGRLTNVEGIMREVLKDLAEGQDERQKSDPEVYEKLQAVILTLETLIENVRFTLTLNDPAGNSWIEPSSAGGEPRDKYAHKKYPRTPAENRSLGLSAALEAVPQVEGGMEDVDILEGQTYELPINCPGCMNPAQLLLQMVNIPHFKQVVLSNTECSACGYSVKDVKTGGEIPEKGKRITIHVKRPEDLQRDILKSETCFMKVPECKLEVVPGTMGGRFTTIEGLLTQIRNDLRGSIIDTDEADIPDSMPEEKKRVWDMFFAQVDRAVKGEVPFTIILEDPLAGSYCQRLGEPEDDKQVIEENYDRTEEEEAELGLADMKTHLNEDGEYVREPAPGESTQSALATESGNEPGQKAEKES